MIPVSSRAQSCLTVVQTLDPVALRKIMADRLRPFLPVMQTDSFDYNQVFSGDEKEKLALLLQIPTERVQDLCRLLAELVHFATYQALEPEKFGEELSELAIPDENRQVLVEFWTQNSQLLLDRAKQFCPSGNQVVRLDWNLGVEVASSTAARSNQPNADLQFALSTGAPKAKERLETVKMDMGGMQMLFEQLEKVQVKLDELSA